MTVVRRNDRCPCGSGKRYKECHGSVGAIPALDGGPAAATLDPTDALARAAQLLTSDVAGAEDLARRALEAVPNHPEALRILGRCDLERGEPAAGLKKLLEAARSMQSIPLGASLQYAVWTDLGYLFSQTLAGMDAWAARTKRGEYSKFCSADEGAPFDETPLVSIVLLVSDRVDWTLDALQSVCGQTYTNIELIVVHDGSRLKDSKRLDQLLDACRFPCRRIAVDETDEPSRINAGVRASAGAFVNVLEARDRFGSTRIATLVKEVANRRRNWGFCNVEFIDDEGRGVRTESDPSVARALELLASIPEGDTVGYSFIHQTFVAVAAGNLFFSRQLFETLDGFRRLPHTYAWDFALRALWFDEPVHVAVVQYTRRVVAQRLSATTQMQMEASHVAMFREFYERACDEATPPNPYAPSLRHWRMHFLKTPFQVGHVLAFPLERLEALGEQIIAQRKAVVAQQTLPGLSLVGFAYGEFGLAENLRALANACLVGGIPFAVKDVDLRLKARQADRSLAPYIVDELCYRSSLFCLNPDMLKPVASLMKSTFGIHRYNIGFWFWELEQIPREWTIAINSVDEIWVATEFVADAMRRATSKPVVKIPTPIEVRLSRSYTRAEFGLEENRFLFLFSFDFNSFARRKNPEGAIAAFKRAFANGRRNVGMIVKSINGANNPTGLGELRGLIGADDRITIVDGFFSRDQLYGLESVADAFVSLHRAEGLGLGLAESMYLGKPVIGTAYSGNLEFMSEDNSCLVGYELVPIKKGEYLYDDERYRWADPDVDQAARWMTRLVHDIEFRERIAHQGQRDIRARFSYARAAALMRSRLTELGLL